MDNTIIVVLSDHGDMMGDHRVVRKGHFQYNGAIWIPYVWSWGDRFKKGLKTDGIAVDRLCSHDHGSMWYQNTLNTRN